MFRMNGELPNMSCCDVHEWEGGGMPKQYSNYIAPGVNAIS